MERFHRIFELAQFVHFRREEPIPDMGIDSATKIESCLITPFQSFENKAFYRTFNKKAAILFYLLVKNHCLQNGNKRLAVLSLGSFIYLNNKRFVISDNCIIALARDTAMSQNKDKALAKINATLQRTIRKRSQRMTTIKSVREGNKKIYKNRLRFVCRVIKLLILFKNY